MTDSVRRERGVTTDSPAASKKIFMLAASMRQSTIKPVVVSLGRGGSTRPRFFRKAVERVEGVPTVFLEFWGLRLVTHVVSALALLCFTLAVFFRGRRRGAFLFYNRLWHYAPALAVCRLLHLPAFLDLEDGETTAGAAHAIYRRFIDATCSAGALLACTALQSATRIRRQMPYYGVVRPRAAKLIPASGQLTIIMSGTICPETGSDALIRAIRSLKDESEEVASQFRFVVTGMGEGIGALKSIASDQRHPNVTVLGRTDTAQYDEVLQSAHIGLSLKSANGLYANTTFPSKTVEMANAGLLVVSTRISDVQEVLGPNGALFLEQPDSEDLADALRWVNCHRDAAATMARSGQLQVEKVCGMTQVRSRLTSFFGSF